MEEKDKINVICGWLEDVGSRSEIAREFMQSLYNENLNLNVAIEKAIVEINDLRPKVYSGMRLESIEEHLKSIQLELKKLTNEPT